MSCRDNGNVKPSSWKRLFLALLPRKTIVLPPEDELMQARLLGRALYRHDHSVTRVGPCPACHPDAYEAGRDLMADLTVGLDHRDADALLWWIEETSVFREQIAPEKTTNLRWEHVEEAARKIEAVADMARRGFPNA